MSSYLSSRQSAKLTGVSKSTIKRHCDLGSLACTRTPGGHRRIAKTELQKWAAQHKIDLRVDAGPMRRTRQLLTVASVLQILEKGDSQALAGQILEHVQRGTLLAEVFDELVAPAMWEIGKRWEQRELDPYEEHLRSGVVVDALALIRSRLEEFFTPQISLTSSQIAIGAGMGPELHCLASSMIELVLHQSGWLARSLGAIVPVESLILAADQLSPRLIWVSYTRVDDVDCLIEENHRLFSSLKPHQRLVVGGQALTRDIRRNINFHFAGDSLRHLASYIGSLENE